MTDAPGARGPVVEGRPAVTGSLPELYEVRFDEREVSQKDAVWREIVAYLERFIDPDAPVLDLACDRGHFIRFVNARERWATDIRDVSASLPPEIHFVQAPGSELARVLPNGHFGTVFMSNYLEHLESGEAVNEQLRVAQALIRPGGRVVILQPNIRLVGPRYWDFIDHRVALTERSLLEAAEIAGLGTVKLVPRFLPYSTKGRLPSDSRLVRLYLAVPLMWRLMGRQTLYVGERRA
jgi:2-polyprenyl-3-methyl-5-hydroxy-6-metoxy-1,4-benzoquinol methylase